ncbi:MAG TPA: hypothetical protein G4O18_10925, partial [Dehalococcoidia bacterium]|nr:hypothetical protein [Dehalococcoidia bacterium]
MSCYVWGDSNNKIRFYFEPVLHFAEMIAIGAKSGVLYQVSVTEIEPDAGAEFLSK